MNTRSYINQQNTPVIPLPNPGEGGPTVTPDDEITTPNITPDNDVYPVIPLPNPGEGGPTVTPDDQTGGGTSGSATIPGIIGTIITVFPKPIIPCFFCNTTQYGTLRFLNASAGYNPFSIYINNQLVVDSLENDEISEYGRVSSGSQTITVSGQNGYVYIQKQITVRFGAALTAAIINRPGGGLDLITITDSPCQSGFGTGCFRVANLSATNQSLNVSLNNFINFRNVNYPDVTGFSYITVGNYTIRVYNNPSVTGSSLVTSTFSLRSNTAYTLYIYNWNPSKDALRTLIVEDRS